VPVETDFPSVPDRRVAVNPDEFQSLLSAAAGVPVLPGARCRGRHHLFDPAAADEPEPVTEARHHQAVRICQSCPALTACGSWVDSLPASKRPPGVIAGRKISARKERRRSA